MEHTGGLRSQLTGLYHPNGRIARIGSETYQTKLIGLTALRNNSSWSFPAETLLLHGLDIVLRTTYSMLPSSSRAFLPAWINTSFVVFALSYSFKLKVQFVKYSCVELTRPKLCLFLASFLPTSSP